MGAQRSRVALHLEGDVEDAVRDGFAARGGETDHRLERPHQWRPTDFPYLRQYHLATPVRDVEAGTIGVADQHGLPASELVAVECLGSKRRGRTQYDRYRAYCALGQAVYSQ